MTDDTRKRLDTYADQHHPVSNGDGEVWDYVLRGDAGVQAFDALRAVLDIRAKHVRSIPRNPDGCVCNLCEAVRAIRDALPEVQ